jgi:prolyl oligopeptidase
MLYGYGGFNISLPSFSIANAVWMENGGVYAVPNLRGGENMEKNGMMQELKCKKSKCIR